MAYYNPRDPRCANMAASVMTDSGPDTTRPPPAAAAANDPRIDSSIYGERFLSEPSYVPIGNDSDSDSKLAKLKVEYSLLKEQADKLRQQADELHHYKIHLKRVIEEEKAKFKNEQDKNAKLEKQVETLELQHQKELSRLQEQNTTVSRQLNHQIKLYHELQSKLDVDDRSKHFNLTTPYEEYESSEDYKRSYRREKADSSHRYHPYALSNTNSHRAESGSDYMPSSHHPLSSHKPSISSRLGPKFDMKYTSNHSIDKEPKKYQNAILCYHGKFDCYHDDCSFAHSISDLAICPHTTKCTYAQCVYHIHSEEERSELLAKVGTNDNSGLCYRYYNSGSCDKVGCNKLHIFKKN